MANEGFAAPIPAATPVMVPLPEVLRLVRAYVTREGSVAGAILADLLELAKKHRREG